jgi:hypothetical protein
MMSGYLGLIMTNKGNLFRVVFLGVISLLSMGVYIALSNSQYRIGFPLDDAWIHQTYARNIASGEWAFIPGVISGGSTSPLWSLILSVGYFLKISPILWTFGINFFVLWCMALIAERFIRTQYTYYETRFPWIGLIFIFEWHLVWSAVSGMETLLFSALVMTFFMSIIEKKISFWLIGSIIGVSIWVRPEAITFIGPALLIWLVIEKPIKWKINKLAKLMVPLCILTISYMIFFYQLTGNLLPTTFYAKQAEYQSLTAIPFLQRFGRLGLQPLIGSLIILIPGFFISLLDINRMQKWGIISAALWVVGMISIYAWRLPVVYQHGRYMIPCMTILLLFSILGLVKYFESKKSTFSIPKTVWIISLLIVLLFFWGSGAIAFGKDVSFIEHQMVDTALWIKNNIPPNKIIATHDIGAMGFFDDHRLVDLAGLITSDIIPIIGNEDQMVDYLNNSDVSYVVSFPDWYPNLTSGLRIIYSGPVDINTNSNTMNVYIWESKH